MKLFLESYDADNLNSGDLKDHNGIGAIIKKN